jgi:hypothetical protein
VDSPALFSKDALEVVLINTACLHLPKLFIMGCMKSKETFPFPTTLDIDKLHESEEAFIPDDSSQYRTPSPGEQQQVQEVKKLPEPGAVIGALILEFADRLASEIVEDALQQWACENIQYYNIPYIESEGSDTTIN